MAAGRLELKKADAVNLPFPHGKFTPATTINASFSSTCPKPCWQMYRTLAPAGRIVISTAATAPRLIRRRMRLYGDGDLLGMLEVAGFEHMALRRTPTVWTRSIGHRPQAGQLPRPCDYDLRIDA